MDIKGIESIRSHRAVRKWDIVALVLFLLAIIAVIVVLCMPKGDFVEVYENGKLVYRKSLKDYGTFDVSGHLKVVIDKQGVKVTHADCPDKLCELQGYISTNGASIVCLPNKITIVIRGDRNDVDVVS